MEEDMLCPLCESSSMLLCKHRQRTYYRCSGCSSAFLHPAQRLSFAEERRRYELHNNDVEDARYQRFVTPLVEQVLSRFDSAHRGLDFGAGTGPVITKLLRDQGYDITVYDPFFYDDYQALEQVYDYIVCCEVMEHFFHPRKSFALLKSLLKPEGSIFCRTSLFTDDIDFSAWHYKNDETHTFYYHPKSIQWIADYFGFTRLRVTSNSLIEFSLSQG